MIIDLIGFAAIAYVLVWLAIYAYGVVIRWRTGQTYFTKLPPRVYTVWPPTWPRYIRLR